MPADLGQLTVALLRGPETTSPDDADSDLAKVIETSAWSLAESVPVGSTAAVALIEHIWAAPLRGAIQRAGGVPLDETWLAQQDVKLLEELEHPEQ